jgi:hypothetical protein
MDCILQNYNARRAARYGKKLSETDRVTLLRSDPHTHTEFQFSPRYSGISFSATTADGSNCCRFKPIEYSHPERWDSLVLPMTDVQEGRARRRADEIEGKSYDLIGLLSHTSDLEIIKPHPDKYWCNEACGELIIAAYDWNRDDFRPDKFTPSGMLFEIIFRLKQMGLPVRLV